jgi:sister chromatid cohesion protein DCC1
MAESLPPDGQPIQLAFSPTSVKESGDFRLLELPPDLLRAIETNSSPFTWAIKGNPTEDAVLCTADKTYSIRSVSLSNSVLVVAPGEEQGQIVVRDTSHELLQVTPVLPKVHKLVGLLRGREYDEGREDLDDDMLDDEQDTQSQPQVRPPARAQCKRSIGQFKKAKKGYLTYAQALTEIQASEVEFTKALKDRRILLMNGNPPLQTLCYHCPEVIHLTGTLRPIAASYLSTILELLLNSLVSLQLSHDSAPVSLLAETLQDDHDIRPQVTKQVMGWFGDVGEHAWRMDVPSVLNQVGMGILRTYRVLCSSAQFTKVAHELEARSHRRERVLGYVEECRG